MLKKKKWIIIGIIGAAVLLIAGSLGGIALAQTNSTGDSPVKTLMARVAEKLGIDQQELEDAFSQAQKDMQTEALDIRLKEMVANGKITQQQADQYKQWIQSRPTDLPPALGSGPGFGPGMRGPGGFRGFPGMCGPGKMYLPPPAPSNTQ